MNQEMAGPPQLALQRLASIAQARTAVMREGSALAVGVIQPWIERSWQRCLARGQRPEQHVAFDAISHQAQHRSAESHHNLLVAAKPVMSEVARTLAATRYFAILTNAAGVVVNVDGPIDSADGRATSIARVGVDLSETAVGTTAIGAALTEYAPVWLHRGEHFFNDNGAYSCAGAPIFAPDGRCAGMLDFTGIEVPERRELLSLAAHAARQIEAGLLYALPHALMLRLSWPGDGTPSASAQSHAQQGLLAVDANDGIVGADSAARTMLGLTGGNAALRLDDVFALSSAALWDAARHPERALDAPLWSGLRVQAQSVRRAGMAALAAPRLTPSALPLKELENSVIRKAVEDARGNVSDAAKALGISRATVYRKLGAKRHGA
jgi:sigma-54 dependent transcriptional regulator, acetoin dehydrogenase operon transcriptional activator AcoR